MSFAQSTSVDTKRVTLGFMMLISGGQSEFLPSDCTEGGLKYPTSGELVRFDLPTRVQNVPQVLLTLRKNVH